MKKINVLLVDDEDLLRQGLRSLLEKEIFVNSISEAGNSEDFHRMLSAQSFDIILLDIKMPGSKGNELLESINAFPIRPKVIAVTGLDGVELTINLLKLGINGIVYKLDGYTEIVKTIQEVLKTGSYFHDRTLRIIQHNANRWDKVPSIALNFQEAAMIKALATGLTTKAMAMELNLTEATAETYRIRLIKKTGAPNTAALLAYAYRNGML